MTADEKRCRQHVESSTATATALVPALGYEAAAGLVKLAMETGGSLKAVAVKEGLLTAEQFEELTSPEAVFRLGSPLPGKDGHGPERA
jgi:aspartate ammonia-lyase